MLPLAARRSLHTSRELSHICDGSRPQLTSEIATRSSSLLRKGNDMKLLGVLLILAGIAAIAYGGFSFTTHKKAVDLGPFQINKAERHSVPVPPILGLAGIAGGALLIFSSSRRAG